jgi:putative hemolysin
MSPITWAVIFFLILTNAFYVAAEFAAVGARRSRIRQLADEGSRLAARLLPVLDRPVMLDRYIAACQIGITLSSLVLGAYGQATLAAGLVPVFEPWGDVHEFAAESAAATVVLVGLTALQVLFGELVPKSLALQHPTRTALVTVLPMQWSLWLFSGFIKALNGSATLVLRLFRVPQSGHRHVHSPEELELLITESREGGLLRATEYRRLYRALRLRTRTARQLLVPRPRVAAIDVTTPVPQALSLVADTPHTRLPLYRESIDNVIGLLHTRDLVLHYLERGAAGSLEEIMRPVLTVFETITADRLLSLMRERRRQYAVIIDEFGATSGIVTLTDVLEELLGKVADERKRREPQPQRLPDGRIRLPGAMRLNEAEPWIGVVWLGEADTVGGHVLGVLGSVPSGGEQVVIDGIQVEVERVSGHAIASVLVRPLVSPEEPHG